VPCLQITTPLSLGLGTQHAPLVEALQILTKSESTTDVSEVLWTEANTPTSVWEVQLSELDKVFVFGFHVPSTLYRMATTIIWDSEVSYKLTWGSDINIYHMQVFVGTGGDSSRESSNSFVIGGGGPLAEDLSQLYLQGGFYPRLPGGPLGAGAGGLPGGSGGRGGGANANPVLQTGLPLLPMNRSLKGTPPTMFNSNRRKTKQFI
jgi:hypothetical protein